MSQWATHPTLYAFLIGGRDGHGCSQSAQTSVSRCAFQLAPHGFSAITDHRQGTPDIPLADALMSAFAMFSLKAPSLLAFDKERTEDNLQRVYGIERVPCDTAMREILDPVEPEVLRPVFKQIFRHLQRGKALEEMIFVEGH